MKTETLQKANEIQYKMKMLNDVKIRLENEEGHFNVVFGISINKESPTNFYPILNEKSLTDELTTISLNHCNKRLNELQEQLDKL